MTLTTQEAVEVLPWAGDRPTTPQGWVRRAEEVAAILEVDAVGRDRARAAPYDEVRLLREAGLVTLLGPAAHGGAGQYWGTACAVVRRVGEGDALTGRLLGDHLLGSRLPALLGTAGQAEEITATATRGAWFFGGPVDSRDGDLRAVDAGRDLVFSGRTTSPPGSRVADVTWLGATVDDHGGHVVALAPSDHPRITFHDGADPAGSGSVTVDDVVLPWGSALGWVDKRAPGRTVDSLAASARRLVVTNLHLGRAAGDLRAARARTRGPAGDAPGPHGTLGDLRSELRAAQTLADRAADAIELLLIDPGGVEPRARREVAALVAAAERRAVRVGRSIGARVPAVPGAPATPAVPDRSSQPARTPPRHDPGAGERGGRP